MPSSPALVPELGIGDADSARLLRSIRELIDATSAAYPVTSISLVGSRDPRSYTAHTGRFRAWGAPQCNVGAGNHLAELVQRYVLKGCELPITVGESVAITTDTLVLYALDGPAGLSAAAPLALLPGAQQRHEWCLKVLRGGAVAWPSSAELRADGIVEPATWLALRELKPAHAEVVASSQAHGVGRYVAWWKE
ncbi:hypothetical protein WG936_01320 [Corynebacterium sp. H127]|uniref:hypothetical protein n=1 Tax=Corynebacterium sp. H127 TaxID=3133418 RepID=UPI0030AEF1E9